jgi:peptidoglycan pentaglycine glycine transferase (the first glycine)
MRQVSQAVGVEMDYTAEDPVWDSFVTQCPGAHYEQITAWARARRAFGWQSYRILVRSEGELIGGAHVLYRRVRKLASIGFISRGPVSKSAETAPLVAQQVVEGLKRTAHTYVVILPHYEGADIVPVLTANAFYQKPVALPPRHLVTATMVIDLNQSLDAILARMKSKTRYNIRHGLRKGIKVTQGGETEVETFYRLMCQLCARRGTTPNPRHFAQLDEIWRCMAPGGAVKLFLAHYNSEVVSGAFAFVYGGIMRVWKAGWSGEHDKHHPNEVLWWEMIKWSKDAGLRQLDFVQIPPGHARAALRGETINDNYWGVTQFKLGFGGEILLLPDAYYRSFNGGIQALLKLGGARLLESPRILKWIGSQEL